jgi:hypothetical protein
MAEPPEKEKTNLIHFIKKARMRTADPYIGGSINILKTESNHFCGYFIIFSPVRPPD